ESVERPVHDDDQRHVQHQRDDEHGEQTTHPGEPARPFQKEEEVTFTSDQNLTMPTLIPQPTRITAAGNKPKLIDEYVGRVNSKDSAVSVAHMRSPQGWSEPGQTPQFDEYTLVL